MAPLKAPSAAGHSFKWGRLKAQTVTPWGAGGAKALVVTSPGADGVAYAENGSGCWLGHRCSFPEVLLIIASGSSCWTPLLLFLLAVAPHSLCPLGPPMLLASTWHFQAVFFQQRPKLVSTLSKWIWFSLPQSSVVSRLSWSENKLSTCHSFSFFGGAAFLWF